MCQGVPALAEALKPIGQVSTARRAEEPDSTSSVVSTPNAQRLLEVREGSTRDVSPRTPGHSTELVNDEGEVLCLAKHTSRKTISSRGPQRGRQPRTRCSTRDAIIHRSRGARAAQSRHALGVRRARPGQMASAKMATDDDDADDDDDDDVAYGDGDDDDCKTNWSSASHTIYII